MIVFRSLLFGLSLLLVIPALTRGDSLPQSIGGLRLEQLQVGEEARMVCILKKTLWENRTLW